MGGDADDDDDDSFEAFEVRYEPRAAPRTGGKKHRRGGRFHQRSKSAILEGAVAKLPNLAPSLSFDALYRHRKGRTRQTTAALAGSDNGDGGRFGPDNGSLESESEDVVQRRTAAQGGSESAIVRQPSPRQREAVAFHRSRGGVAGGMSPDGLKYDGPSSPEGGARRRPAAAATVPVSETPDYDVGTFHVDATPHDNVPAAPQDDRGKEPRRTTTKGRTEQLREEGEGGEPGAAASSPASFRAPPTTPIEKVESSAAAAAAASRTSSSASLHRRDTSSESPTGVADEMLLAFQNERASVPFCPPPPNGPQSGLYGSLSSSMVVDSPPRHLEKSVSISVEDVAAGEGDGESANGLNVELSLIREEGEDERSGNDPRREEEEIVSSGLNGELSLNDHDKSGIFESDNHNNDGLDGSNSLESISLGGEEPGRREGEIGADDKTSPSDGARSHGALDGDRNQATAENSANSLPHGGINPPPLVESYEVRYRPRPPAHPGKLRHRLLPDRSTPDAIHQLKERAKLRLHASMNAMDRHKPNGIDGVDKQKSIAQSKSSMNFSVFSDSASSFDASYRSRPPIRRIEMVDGDDVSTIAPLFSGDVDGAITCASSSCDPNSMSDVNSMSAIYSHDEDKMEQRKMCIKDLESIRESPINFKAVNNFDNNSLGAESELTADTGLPDIHHLTGWNFNFDGLRVGKRKNGLGRKTATRDCNYGSSLETAYEEFGIERQLLPLDEGGREGTPLSLPSLVGRLPEKMMGKSLKKSFRTLRVNNPVDVDEISTVVSVASKSSLKSSRSEDVDENTMVELVKLDTLKWLVNCGDPRLHEWDTSLLDDDSVDANSNGDRTEGVDATCNALMACDGDIDAINVEKLMDAVDYAINGYDKACDTTEYDCQTEYGGKSIFTKGRDTIGDTTLGDDTAAWHNDDDEESRMKPPQQTGQKEAVANSDAIQMQNLVFVSPNLDNPNSTIGFLA